MVFPICNIKTDILNNEFDVDDSPKSVAYRAKKIFPYVGIDVMLMSDGHLEKGNNPGLMTEEGAFGIAGREQGRFWWNGDEYKTGLNSYVVTCDGSICLGNNYVRDDFGRIVGMGGGWQLFKSPVYTVGGLFDKHFRSMPFKMRQNYSNIPVDRKISFLKQFLDNHEIERFSDDEFAAHDMDAQYSALQIIYKQEAFHIAQLEPKLLKLARQMVRMV